MAVYLSRNAACGTLDTLAQCTTDGSRGTVGNFVVPEGCHSIVEMHPSVGDGARVSTACGGTAVCVLKGPGLVHGEQTFAIAGCSSLDTGNTGKCYIYRPEVIPLDIAVTPGLEIECWVAQSGVDWGTPEIAIGLVFVEASAKAKMHYMTRNGPAGDSVNTALAFGTLFLATTPGAIQTAGFRSIKAIFGVGGNNTPVATAAGSCLQAVIGGTGLKGGEFVVQCSGEVLLSTTTGSSGDYIAPGILLTDVELQSGSLTMNGYQTGGVDVGKPEVAITLGLEEI